MNKISGKKIESMIFCWAFWDSLWIPVEMKTQQQIYSILKQHNIEGSKVIEFLPPSLHELYQTGWYNQNIKVISSDDTYCTRASMQSLYEQKGINFENMMLKNIGFFNKTDFWYGGTTKKAYTKFQEGYNINETGSEGWWNGIIMKLAPLSTYLLAKWYPQKNINTYLDIFTKITHTHESVVHGTRIHHMFLTYLLENKNLKNIWQLFQDMLDFCKKYETPENTIPLSPILNTIITLEKNWDLYTLTDEQILDFFGWWDQKITSVSWRIDVTIWMCYALFLRNSNISWIIDAVSIWWDTDTYGAIVWNMVGAYTWNNPNDKYLDQIPEIQELKNETKQFIRLIQNISE